MRIIRLFGIGLAILAPLTGLARAQDIHAGETIARQWCAHCHQTGPDPAIASDATPAFAAVARAKGMTETALAAFLSSSHGRMPDYALSRQEIRDVSAYIMSLKK